MLSFLSTAAAVTLPTAAPPFRLPMLPFDYADAMLPGETLQVALDEPAHHALLLEALHRRHGPLDKGCFGQLLKRDHDRASSIAPLLQITQTLPARSHASTWIEVKCVGRARVDRFDQSPDACFDAAYVRELVDRPTAAAGDGGDGGAAAGWRHKSGGPAPPPGGGGRTVEVISSSSSSGDDSSATDDDED